MFALAIKSNDGIGVKSHANTIKTFFMNIYKPNETLIDVSVLHLKPPRLDCFFNNLSTWLTWTKTSNPDLQALYEGNRRILTCGQ